MKAICGLCGEAVGADIFEHYEDRHPERHRGDWELVSWPDGVQVVLDDDLREPWL